MGKISIILLNITITAVITLLFVGCGGSENEHYKTGEDNTILLIWEAPTKNVNGTPLTDLAGYKVYYGSSQGNYTETVDVGNNTKFSIENLSTNKWYFAVTAYNISGIESEYSEEIGVAVVGEVYEKTLSPNTTYYVDAKNGDDSNNGISQSNPWKTITKINASSFKPGDNILFKRGEVWREALMVPSSGTKDYPIIFGSYGEGSKPEIRGSIQLTNWIRLSQNIFYTFLSGKIEAKQAWEEGKLLNSRKTNFAELSTDGDWYHDIANNRFYLCKDFPPINIEVSQLERCIWIIQKDYIKIKDLKLSRSNEYGIQWMHTNHLTLDNLEITYHYYDGTISYNPTDRSNYISIQHCEVSYNGSSGISVNGENYDVLIQNNSVHHNCRNHTDDIGHKFTAGIKIWGNNSADRAIIQNNHIYESMSNGDWKGAGIWVDEWGTDAVVRYNYVHDTALHGIFIEHTHGAEVYYNIIHSCGHGFPFGDGIAVHRSSSYNKVYNNTIYNCNDAGLSCSGSYPPQAGDMIGNIFRNNISIGNRNRALKCYRGGENDGIYGTENVYENNCFGNESLDFIEWGLSKTYSTYEDWEFNYGKQTFSIIFDPIFVDISSFDFHIKYLSPTIDAGAGVGLVRDFNGTVVPQGDIVDVGAFEFIKINTPNAPTKLKLIN